MTNRILFEIRDPDWKTRQNYKTDTKSNLLQISDKTERTNPNKSKQG